ncbi:trigger factor [Fusibacter tunisiensis]|uniref:peptidylprolyl isomerase n=1 Tax=Fusibacter tunisiensis TaxID=1008308 RepID=A0ABS2MQS3_9FIRM|nr:trigger factor [Fusibacter tunisiensis]MBM7561745.1 trigger factor [Fusibacter tunisiensis]
MNKWTKLLLVFSLLMLVLAGCSSDTDANDTPTEPVAGSVETDGFSYSDGINADGKWDGVTALDLVTLTDYKGISIPKDVHEIPEASVESEISRLMESYTAYNEVMDRAIVDGDTVNIDYVGKVDDVEFEGGSTGGNGTEVTIGVTQYIDDFLEQLIGHMPGETFDIEVTFPENYGNETLNGKDAVFTVTINSIQESYIPELTDAFVMENFSESFGFTTVDMLKTTIKDDLQKNAIANYVQDHLFENSSVDTVPESLVTYQANAFLDYYEQTASQYGMTLIDFVNAYLQVESIDALLESSKNEHIESAQFSLIMQAIIESENLTVSEAELVEFFKVNMGVEDYSDYEARYGKPYLVFNILQQNALSLVIDTAVLE